MINKYIGIPFKERGRDMDGFDCIGLVIHIHKENGHEIPDIWNYEKADSSLARANLINELIKIERGESGWVKSEPGEGCTIVFRIANAVSHVGYMIDSKRFIHVMRGTKVCVEDSTSPLWKKRIVGVYKWFS